MKKTEIKGKIIIMMMMQQSSLDPGLNWQGRNSKWQKSPLTFFIAGLWYDAWPPRTYSLIGFDETTLKLDFCSMWKLKCINQPQGKEPIFFFFLVTFCYFFLFHTEFLLSLRVGDQSKLPLQVWAKNNKVQ